MALNLLQSIVKGYIFVVTRKGDKHYANETNGANEVDEAETNKAGEADARGSSPRFVKISNGPNTSSECSNLSN